MIKNYIIIKILYAEMINFKKGQKYQSKALKDMYIHYSCRKKSLSATLTGCDYALKQGMTGVKQSAIKLMTY